MRFRTNASVAMMCAVVMGTAIADTPAAQRFPALTVETVAPDVRALAEQIMKVSSVGLAGPYNPLLRSPLLGQRMFDLLDYLRWHSSVPTRLNEFAILIIGRQWRSQVEWYSHGPIALKAGLSQKVIDELRQNQRPASMQADEAVVYDFVTELTANRDVSDATYARAKALLGEQGVVDLTAVAGTYISVAMLIAMAREMPPAGKDPPFKPGDP